jgi:RimJ/RimL family protein N-acetyltransferase
MVCNNCVLETPRLLVREWHSPPLAEWPAFDLLECLPSILTPKVTAALPPDWQGAYSTERTRQWIIARDLESTNLLVVDRQTLHPAGLMLLFETQAPGQDGVEVRLGYLMAESTWGNGLVSELVQGFVEWCRGQAVVSIEGGVGRDNQASRRVLEKNGFELVTDIHGMQEELFYRLRLSSGV